MTLPSSLCYCEFVYSLKLVLYGIVIDNECG